MKSGKNLMKAIGLSVVRETEDDKKKGKPANGVKFTDAEKEKAKLDAQNAPAKNTPVSMQDRIDADKAGRIKTPENGVTFTSAEKAQAKLKSDVDTQNQGSVPTPANRKAVNRMQPQSRVNN